MATVFSLNEKMIRVAGSIGTLFSFQLLIKFACANKIPNGRFDPITVLQSMHAKSVQFFEHHLNVKGTEIDRKKNARDEEKDKWNA